MAGGGGKQRADAPDLSEAVDWVRRAAEGGLGLAMSRLATVLRNGKGVPRDDAAASLWYRQVNPRGCRWGAWEGEGGGLGPCRFGRRADVHAWPAPWRARPPLSLSLSMGPTSACLPPPVLAGDQCLQRACGSLPPRADAVGTHRLPDDAAPHRAGGGDRPLK